MPEIFTLFGAHLILRWFISEFMLSHRMSLANDVSHASSTASDLNLSFSCFTDFIVDDDR